MQVGGFGGHIQSQKEPSPSWAEAAAGAELPRFSWPGLAPAQLSLEQFPGFLGPPLKRMLTNWRGVKEPRGWGEIGKGALPGKQPGSWLAGNLWGFKWKWSLKGGFAAPSARGGEQTQTEVPGLNTSSNSKTQQLLGHFRALASHPSVQ